MILVDANLLVYAKVSELPQHREARRWLDSQLNSSVAIGMPWPSLLGFLRVVTNPRIFARPLSLTAAWGTIEEWLDLPPVWIPAPGSSHREILGKLLLKAHAHGNLVPDAHLAALAIEHGLMLYSTDGDFARFDELKWRNPLAD
ncbi:MAG: type II toxin-antitoxin system VapC family toxin [Bryobacterales bacterium]